jgi:hypothetical protein
MAAKHLRKTSIITDYSDGEKEMPGDERFGPLVWPSVPFFCLSIFLSEAVDELKCANPGARVKSHPSGVRSD